MGQAIVDFVLWIPGWYYSVWILCPILFFGLIFMDSESSGIPFCKWECRWILSSFAGPIPMILIWICVWAVLLLRWSFPEEE